jgi:hypothetical protein
MIFLELELSPPPPPPPLLPPLLTLGVLVTVAWPVVKARVRLRLSVKITDWPSSRVVVIMVVYSSTDVETRGVVLISTVDLTVDRGVELGGGVWLEPAGALDDSSSRVRVEVSDGVLSSALEDGAGVLEDGGGCVVRTVGD